MNESKETTPELKEPPMWLMVVLCVVLTSCFLVLFAVIYGKDQYNKGIQYQKEHTSWRVTFRKDTNYMDGGRGYWFVNGSDTLKFTQIK